MTSGGDIIVCSTLRYPTLSFRILRIFSKRVTMTHDSFFGANFMKSCECNNLVKCSFRY